jgi:hypothetical protein
MVNKLELHPGEQLLRKDPVSIVAGKLASRTGICYITNQRVVVDSEILLAGVAGAISILMRAILRKFNQFGTRHQEIALSNLSEISVGKYGLNKTVDIVFEDGEKVRLVFSAKTREKWLNTLDEALSAFGLQRVEVMTDLWQVSRVANQAA